MLVLPLPVLPTTPQIPAVSDKNAPLPFGDMLLQVADKEPAPELPVLQEVTDALETPSSGDDTEAREQVMEFCHVMEPSRIPDAPLPTLSLQPVTFQPPPTPEPAPSHPLPGGTASPAVIPEVSTAAPMPAPVRAQNILPETPAMPQSDSDIQRLTAEKTPPSPEAIPHVAMPAITPARVVPAPVSPPSSETSAATPPVTAAPERMPAQPAAVHAPEPLQAAVVQATPVVPPAPVSAPAPAAQQTKPIPTEASSLKSPAVQTAALTETDDTHTSRFLTDINPLELPPSGPVENASPSPETIALREAVFGTLTQFFNTRQTTASAPAPMKDGLPVTARETGLPLQTRLSSFRGQPAAAAMRASAKIEAFTARIRVYPPDLGEILANIDVRDGVAKIRFGTENAEVRHFLESTAPQLREAFAASKLTLEDVFVQSGMSQQQQQQEPSDTRRAPAEMARFATDEDMETAIATDRKRPENHDALVDAWA